MKVKLFPETADPYRDAFMVLFRANCKRYPGESDDCPWGPLEGLFCPHDQWRLLCLGHIQNFRDKG